MRLPIPTDRALLTAMALTASAAISAASPYTDTVLQDQPLAFYPLNETPPALDVALNRIIGGTVPNGQHVAVVPGATGAILSSSNPAASYAGSRTVVPFTAALNPPASASFTIEAWVKPTIDGLSNAQAPLFNRKTAGNRQGWVFFQRASDVGWNFRMYNQSGDATSVDITGGPYIVNEWTHLAATWNGPAATATLYVNGVAVASRTSAAYAANTSSAFSAGAYSDPAGDNAYTGDIDEVAFYPSALTAAKINEHFLYGTNPAPAVPYPQKVAADGAILHLRMDEPDPARSAAINRGSLSSDAEGLHFPGAKHQVTGALAGSSDSAMGYRLIDKNSSDGGYPTVLPFRPELNTATFSIEAWVKPLMAGNANAQCPLYNYKGGDVSRSGWVMYQRSPAEGWNFRSYNGVGTTRAIDLTAGPYTPGQWQHLVVTFNSTTQTAVFYVNGAQAGTQTVSAGLYVPNISDIMPSIGGFSNGWENGFEGDIDEVAFYQTVLSAAQVQEHYQNGTNAARSTPYETMIASHNPVAYFRLNEPAKSTAANAGSLGAAAGGTYVNSPLPVEGPLAPAFPGFGSPSPAVLFNGSNMYIELLNPPELNLAGQITLEAWVQPAAQTNASNNIIAHGANNDFTGEVFLRIENGNYEIGSTGGKASAPVPAGDLGTNGWIHLAGTWDGTRWNLYRNASLLASAAGPGPVAVNNANWAIGARGRWKNANGYPAGPVAEQRAFAGVVVAPAIYGTALTKERIAAHYAAGLGVIPLTITRQNGTTQLTWGAGTLQESADLGSWTDLTGVVSPYVPEAGTRKYFRLRY